MKTKILVIAVVQRGELILLRKKPDGSLPYRQTWYLFGGELTSETTPERAVQDVLRFQTGIEIRLSEQIYWDSEIKTDLDGEVKQFIYLDAICEYMGGELKLSEGIERLEWVAKNRLKDYDHVPPSLSLFKKLGYITD